MDVFMWNPIKIPKAGEKLPSFFFFFFWWISTIQEPGAKPKPSAFYRVRSQAEQLRDTQSHPIKSCSWILNGVDNFLTDHICSWYVKTRVMKSYPSGHIWIIAQVG